MPSIHLTTFIAAPIERVFDLSRHLAVYKYVFNGRKETFTARSSNNLVTDGDTLTLTVKHLGKTRLVGLKITNLKKPYFFTEEQSKGDLQSYRHDHHFKRIDNGTILIDVLDFGAPRDLVGKLIGNLYLKDYLEKLVLKRNEVIRQYAETERWRAVLG